MVKSGDRQSQRLVDYDLFGSVVEMIVSSNHVRHSHECVIYRHHEVVRRRAITSGDDEIIQLFGFNGDSPFDPIFKDDISLQRGLDAHHRLDPFWRRAGKIAVSSIVSWPLPTLHLLLSEPIELLFGHIAVVGFALVQKLLDVAFVDIEALGLVGHLAIVVESHPLEGLQDRLRGLLAVSGQVRIFDT